MSVIEIRSGTATYGLDQITATRVFRISTGNRGQIDGARTALAGAGIYGGVEHNSISGCYAKELTITEDPNQDGVYEAQVEYSTLSYDSPLNKPVQISWGAVAEQEELFIDEEDNPVMNSAGEPFESFVVRDKVEVAEVSIVRNEAAPDPAFAFQYAYTVNTNAFTLDGVSVGIGRALCLPIQISEWKEENGIAYREVRYSIRLTSAEHGFDLRVYDIGYERLYTVPGSDPPEVKRKRIKEGPEYITRPYPLDGNGQPKDNASDKPAILTFKVYPEVSFAGLNLPS